MTSRRQRKLDAVVSSLQLKYGSQAIQRATPMEQAPTIPRISTSFAMLDAALQGGLPRGRITEICGPTTSGKLTLAAKAIAALHQQDAHSLAAWFDPTRTCDPDYFHRCGVDLQRLVVVHADTLTDALALILHLAESNTLGLLAVDGLAADGVKGAALWAGALARLTTLLARTATAVVFLTEPQPALPALEHAAAVRMLLRREHWIMRGADVRGYEGQAEIIKNRFGAAGVQVTVRIVFNGTVRGDGL